MTEATERERRHETDETETTNVRYSGETPDNEIRDRETYDRDRDVDDVSGTEFGRPDGGVSYRAPDEARAGADEAERDQARTDVDRSDLDRTDLDRAEAERAGVRAGVDGSEADLTGARTSELAQPGTAPAGVGYQNQAGYKATASQPDGANVGVVDDPDAVMRRWQDVQTSFVDDPRQAVQEADGLVQQVMQQVGQRLASERAGLEQVWSRGGDVSTEDLRQALRQYRSFFNRLLHV